MTGVQTCALPIYAIAELKVLKKSTVMTNRTYNSRLNKLKKDPSYNPEMDKTTDLYLEYLIAMLQGVQRGYNLPELITLEQYQYIRDHKELDPVLAGFVGFGCSFGGKWYGGYARNKTGTNYALQSKRSLLKDMATLQNAEFVCGDYRRLCIRPAP